MLFGLGLLSLFPRGGQRAKERRGGAHAFRGKREKLFEESVKEEK